MSILNQKVQMAFIEMEILLLQLTRTLLKDAHWEVNVFNRSSDPSSPAGSLMQPNLQGFAISPNMWSDRIKLVD